MKSYDTVKQRILDNITVDIDKREGSFTDNLVSPVALELSMAYENQDTLVDMAFIRKAEYKYLDLKCEEYGIIRKQGVEARGICVVTGDNGTIIPKDSFLYVDDLYFIVLEDCIISSVGVDMPIKAVDIGTRYNLLTNTELTMQDPILGVTKITIKADVNNGVNVETDEELKNRYFETIKKSYTSGNVAHYEQWTMEVNGVGLCKVYPLKNGNGTVEIVITNSDMLGASKELIGSVIKHVEINRPIGANVSIVSATEKAININVNLTLASGYTVEEVREEFTNRIKDFFKEMAFKTSYVSTARIGNLLLDTNGVFDYTNLTVNGGTGNISLTDTEIPKVGNIEMVV